MKWGGYGFSRIFGKRRFTGLRRKQNFAQEIRDKGFRYSARQRNGGVYTRQKTERVCVCNNGAFSKKFRWSIVSRLQNTSIDVIENLYRANYEHDVALRLKYQTGAAVSLNLLDFYAETAKTKQAISLRQMAILARGITECKKLLSGWIKSTKQSKN